MHYNKWTSRKFLTGVCSFVALLVNQIWGIELDPAVLMAIVIPIVAFIVGESVIDAVK